VRDEEEKVHARVRVLTLFLLRVRRATGNTILLCALPTVLSAWLCDDKHPQQPASPLSFLSLPARLRLAHHFGTNTGWPE
jgi:hypothetical protein